MTSVEKSMLLLKAAERCKLIEAHLLLARSEIEIATMELRSLQQQLQISPPLPVDTQ